MSFHRLFVLLLLGSHLLPAASPENTRPIALESVAWGLKAPVAMADDGTGRLLIVEQRGVIRLVEKGKLSKTVVLDISPRVEYGGECGLLGLALHPSFLVNGRIFVNYTTNQLRPLKDENRTVARPVAQTVVAEFTVDLGSMVADAKQEREILRFDQPFLNHNGGEVKFGPDGKLYIGTGDGGSAGDPLRNGQSLGTLLGKILRVDVNGKEPCTIPPDNPFINTPGACPEIWAFGLRNPWRFSFDRVTGDLYAGDVGQNTWEEIDLIQRGKNYGWSAREGAHDFLPQRAVGRMEDPIKEYGRSTGGSVVGGYVYRGKRFPSLDGMYIYGDFISQRIFGLRRVGVNFDGALLRVGFPMSAFGEDHDGELYVFNYAAGDLYRLVVGDPARKTAP